MPYFPIEFRLRLLTGPRGGTFERADDAFQQLVGDWAREVDAQALTTTTAGADGAIDHWITGDPQGTPLLRDAAFPSIVECKWHDEDSESLTANIMNGWKAVADKLTKKAALGWPGLYAPWKKARGYLYCISGRFPHTDARLELQKTIKDFFAALPPDQKPPITWVSVADWPTLRTAFDRHFRLRDRWMGLGDEKLLDHRTVEARLSGMRAYLREEKLPYVPPDANAPEHPERLLEALEHGFNHSGVLLAGPGGIGKTRTAMEVARLADRRGWRVLHLSDDPGESAATSAEDLARVIVPDCDGATTLLVVDYLEQQSTLNSPDGWSDLRRRVIGPVAERNGRLAVLALCRSGALRAKGNVWRGFFAVHELAPSDERREAVIDAMLTNVAPRARERLGIESLRAVVGRRPIIALFIARELERRAEAGASSETLRALLSEMRGDTPDLGRWLEKRLREDQLLRQEESPDPFLPSSAPAPMVVAGAAVLGACPLYPEPLVEVARRTLESLNIGDETAAKHLVDVLSSMGWVEEIPGANGTRMLATAHDVVADEVVERCVVDPTTRHPRASVITQLLHAGTRDIRVLGRFATTFNRMTGAWDDAPRAELDRQLSDWLWSQREAWDDALHGANTDKAGYALGALLSSPFAAGLLAHWNALVAPWLNTNAVFHETRHALTRALALVPDDRFTEVAPSAVVWLRNHGETTDASRVLAPLLKRTPACADLATPAIAAALTWLHKNGATAEARFVLHSLLGRNDLSESQAPKAITRALEWLDEFSDTAEARFVLHPLLGRNDLSEDQAPKAITRALEWLDEFSDTAEAGFVLNSLLGRNDLSEGQAPLAITRALEWLEEFSEIADAQFVLNSLLGRNDLSEGQAPLAITQALGWLEKFPDTAEAQFVLHPLIGRNDLSEDQAPKAITQALGWLEKFPDTAEAQFVLHPLIGRNDLSEDQAPLAITQALGWLEKFPDTAEAGFVLHPLLKRRDIEERRSEIVDATLEWLAAGENAITSDASHVLKELWRLGRDIPENARAPLFEHSAAWIALHWRSPDGDFLINRTLRSPLPEKPLWRAVAAKGLRRLRTRWSVEDASITVAILKRAPLLRRRTKYWLLARFLAIFRHNDGLTIWLARSVRITLHELLKFFSGTGRSPRYWVDHVTHYIDQTWRDEELPIFDAIITLLPELARRTGEPQLIADAERLKERLDQARAIPASPPAA